MPVLGCFQGRAIARAMCTTVVYHSGGQNPLILPDLLESQAFECAWCPEEDSNLHGFHHWYLKPARLPIPPSGHAVLIGAGLRFCQYKAWISRAFAIPL